MTETITYPSKEVNRKHSPRAESSSGSIRFRRRDKAVLDKLLIDEVINVKQYEVLHDLITDVEKCEQGMYRTSSVSERVDGGTMSYEHKHIDKRRAVEQALENVRGLGKDKTLILQKIINDTELTGEDVQIVRDNFFDVVDVISRTQVSE
jgi:hypothetical protein